MKQKVSLHLVQKMMIQFADLTGLSSSKKIPRRYLWTDAFAVCNFLGLYNQTGEAKYLQLALSLVDQVHNVLGRHRQDDLRTGWVSGLDEQEGKMHPARAGLRIGKTMNERQPTDLFDENLEWDRDGQYYHYLTKWMHALNRVNRVTQDFRFNQWAIELAKTAHARFTYVPSFGNRKRMYWKMSIDLSYPLVPSMGHHDPLDGFITYNQLQATANSNSNNPSGTDLQAEIADMADICAGKSWTTDDPLGIGGLLFDACRVTQLILNRYFEQTDLLDLLLDSSLLGLESFLRQNSLRLPGDYRLAFRELGLSIGLRAVKEMHRMIEEIPESFLKTPTLFGRIETLLQYEPLIEDIERFWLDPINQQSQTWTAHQDINRVMLATSLAPDGYLTL